jgi:hypothetical protein
MELSMPSQIISGENKITLFCFWHNIIIDIAKTNPVYSRIFVAMGALHVSRVTEKMISQGYSPEILLEKPITKI